jgi:hypothetical protein
VERLPPEELEELRPAMVAAREARLGDLRPDAESVVIPTGSLYIEALPGTHAVLEDYKLLHRAYDVAQVATDLVSKRLEQLRLAARLVKEVLDDPDTEKTIAREGNVGPIVTDV